MDKVDLNELPKWSPWPARLLGLAAWQAPTRTLEKIDREYDKDKYARCLAYFQQSQPQPKTEQIRQFELALDSSAETCVSRQGTLYRMSVGAALDLYYSMFLEILAEEIKRSKTVVELGSGYGYNGFLFNKCLGKVNYLGGEYSQNAVQLASLLYREQPHLRVVHFNFYQEDSYTLLQDAEPPVLVLTAHAIEQLPKAGVVLDSLKSHRDRIGSVVHFEPVFEHHDETLLGLMRRRYQEMNDYNRDLLSQLKRRPEVRIVRESPDILGFPPFNATSVIQWKFI